mmetsp:Transcript_75123/g.135314  ORF Transcript_75123/g.135314 Transcript_75123/m.135314 type:complete len:209 (-) Transcript_75123:371-997(-)
MQTETNTAKVATDEKAQLMVGGSSQTCNLSICTDPGLSPGISVTPQSQGEAGQPGRWCGEFSKPKLSQKISSLGIIQSQQPRPAPHPGSDFDMLGEKLLQHLKGPSLGYSRTPVNNVSEVSSGWGRHPSATRNLLSTITDTEKRQVLPCAQLLFWNMFRLHLAFCQPPSLSLYTTATMARHTVRKSSMAINMYQHRLEMTRAARSWSI